MVTAPRWNTASNFRIRDDNNNLTMVNGQITSGNIGANQGNQQASSGVGTGGAGAAYGQATAIGNQPQVQVIGFNNTVIVNSNADQYRRPRPPASISSNH